MRRAALVLRIETDFHRSAIADVCAGCLANIAVQAQLETAVADRHHVDAPSLRRRAIDAFENGQRLASTRLDGIFSVSADKDVGTGFVYLYA